MGTAQQQQDPSGRCHTQLELAIRHVQLLACGSVSAAKDSNVPNLAAKLHFSQVSEAQMRQGQTGKMQLLCTALDMH
jgi:hypothetical protein